MSFWDDKQSQATDSVYLSSELKESGSKATLQFIGMAQEDQNEAAQFKTRDGKQWRLTFKNEAGEERFATQGTLDGRLISAMREASVEPGEWITVTRVGVGTATNYLIEKKPQA